MTEYSRHIEEYANYQHSSFSKLVPPDEWGNTKIADAYLQKYWLPEKEYLNVWKKIQNDIFVEGKSLPDLVFASEFQLITLTGGSLFLEVDFKKLQKAMQEIGEETFVVIQHSQEFTENEPMFRMKFPVNITWQELTSGNYISAVLFEMGYNEYYVFGASGNWGKYSANDYTHPLDIIGFKKEYASIFTEQFRQSQEEKDEMQDWLPQAYKNLIYNKQT